MGIQIHESPRVSGKSSEILEPGMVITIEPGVYGIPIQSRAEIQNTKDKIQDGRTYGLRYEEMVFVDKEKLRVL